MLNEIMKGMDNAAEKINENFQNGSIIESGSTVDGYWARYGDGRQVCVRTVTVDSNIGTGGSAASFEYPKPFIDVPSGSYSIASSGSAALSNMFKNVVLFTTDTDWQLRDGGGSTVNVNGTLVLKAEGRWKE